VRSRVSIEKGATLAGVYTRVSVNGETRQYSLRVTQVYRREGREWKVAHRDADTLTQPE
jgi:ketosteroid isomerase-like protein